MATTITEKPKKKERGRPISETQIDHRKKEDKVFRSVYNGPPEIPGQPRPLTTREKFLLSMKQIKEEQCTTSQV